MPPNAGGGASSSRRRTGIVAACVGGALLVLFGVIGYLGSRDDSKGSDAGSATSGTSGGQNSAGSSTGGSKASSAPKPAVFKNINLTDGYYLKFSDDPLVPQKTGVDDVYYQCDMFNDCTFGSYHSRLALLDQGTRGSLDACKQETRYLPSYVAAERFSKGRQLCVTTEGGTVALLTFRGQAPATSDSHYLTLDASVWRDAVPATDEF
ncbi:hypothetical protein ACGFYV_27525 [Streptomyces sp. NPDC048297]|uniref:hypothetical protein n=1 Tax=Streptomyces sp. NPDC048297 TaxID=3365531 RepID=UPI00371A965A